MGAGVAAQLSRGEPSPAADYRSALAVRAAGRRRPQSRSLVSGVRGRAGAEAVPRTAGSRTHVVMLYQELPSIDSAPLGGVTRWLMPALVAGAAMTVALL